MEFFGIDGSLLVERMGGHAITQLLSPAGETVLKELGDYEFQGNVYSAHPADMREKDASEGYILAGDNRIDVAVANDLGGLSILHINSDGGFVVQVVELVLNKSFHIDQKVYRYDASGKLTGMARIPLASQYTSVDHGVAIGPDGEVYAMITQPDGAEIQRLSFVSGLAPILIPPMDKEEEQQLMDVSFIAETCRERDLIIDVAKEYMNNSTYLSSYHINDNGACPGRVKPSYLGNAGYYSSVPYAWNLWDTIDQFNGFMSGGSNGYFAGNASGTYVSCGRGIDCSGLVSRAWGLGSHYGTCNLESISTQINRTDLQPGDIMNRCSSTPLHAMIFDSTAVNGINVYEAVIGLSLDKVVYRFYNYTSIDTYTPRKYNNVCNKIHLPLIFKTEMGMNAAISPLNPYPPPDSSLSSTPYQLPYP